MGAVFFEILVLLIFPPLKLIARLFGANARARVQRWEDAVLHQVHAMGAEAQTIYEIEKNASARAYMASGALDQTSAIPKDNLDATERARRTVGADLARQQQHLPGAEQLQRGPTRVEASNAEDSRSEQMKEAMLEAQRLRRAREQRSARSAERLKRRE